MVYRVPDTSKENWEEKYLVKKGEYLCYDCNKPQQIKNLSGYLEPCRYCGCTIFFVSV